MDSDRASGFDCGGGGEGIFASLDCACFDNGRPDAELDVSVAGSSEASKLSGGVSTCWVVELKYRARFGRRKVGGSAEDGIRVSKTDFLIVLLSIVRLDISGLWAIAAEVRLSGSLVI